jgi:hypothetical protein
MAFTPLLCVNVMMSVLKRLRQKFRAFVRLSASFTSRDDLQQCCPPLQNYLAIKSGCRQSERDATNSKRIFERRNHVKETEICISTGERGGGEKELNFAKRFPDFGALALN